MKKSNEMNRLAEILTEHFNCDEVFDPNGKLSFEAVDACVDLKVLLKDLSNAGIIPKDDYVAKINSITKDYFKNK